LIVPGDPEAQSLAIPAYLAELKETGESSFDAVAGVGMAGGAFSSPVSYLLNGRTLQVRRKDADWKPDVVEGAMRLGWLAVQSHGRGCGVR
jgi:hypothetical protein